MERRTRQRRVGGGRRARRVDVVEVGTEPLLSSAGGVLLVETARAVGLDSGLSQALAPWRPPTAVHDPGKVLADLATSVALGGDCLADVALLRAQPDLFGHVASDPTVSRLVDRLADHADRALAALRAARADARALAWAHASPVPEGQPVVVDLDATLVLAHSEKEAATPTFKRTFGHHPLLAFVDHGPHGAGEPLAGVLRPGSAGANDAGDHIAVLDLALAQLPADRRAHVVVRADAGGGTKEFLHHLSDLGLTYSVGIGSNVGVDTALLARVRPECWTQAEDTDGTPRDHAQVADLTALLPHLTGRGWPQGMRVLARREFPHPGAQLRLTDVDGWRVTLFATNTPTGGAGTSHAKLEVRHRSRGRAEDRIRCLKDTGARNLPLHDLAQNRIWLETVLLAADLLAWTATLALDGHRLAEPKRLRLHLLAVAGRLVHTGRRLVLRLPAAWPWAAELVRAHTRLRALPGPAG